MTVAFLLWLFIGAMLIVAEIMTGTFYLLIFGIAAWVGAGVAYGEAGIDYQLSIAGITAVVGLVAVRLLKQRSSTSSSGNDLDIGNEVRVDAVSGERLKVHYRGATWDAVLEEGTTAIQIGDTGVIKGMRGNLLIVQPPPR